MDARADHSAALFHRLQGQGYKCAHGGVDDRGVQGLGRRLVRTARPVRAKTLGEALTDRLRMAVEQVVQAHMAEHRINVHPSLPLEVNAADLVIEVTSDGSKLGELRVSRGSIDWAPRNHTYPTRSLTWEQFDVLMREEPA